MKLITKEAAASHMKDGMTIMIGGFLSCGTPETLTDLIAAKGIGDLTIIANDGGIPGTGIAKLIAAGLVKKLIATHIGMNPQVGRLMNEGALEVELIPQGTMAEQIRAGGSGLGGILTKTGLGTDLMKGKRVITVDGEDYLFEKPMRADLALIRGSIVDELGNIVYKGTTQNFNPMMAAAADLVIAEAEQVVTTGSISGEHIHTPCIFVDYIVRGDTNV